MGIPTRVQTAIEMREIAEPYVRRRAIRHMVSKGYTCHMLSQHTTVIVKELGSVIADGSTL